MKKGPLWIAAAAVFLVALLLIKDALIAGIVKESASSVLGTSVEIDRLRIALFKPSVEMSGFRVMQPRGFPKGPLLDVAETRADYDIGALFAGKIHFRKAEVVVREAVMIRDRNGALNVDALKVAKKDAGEKTGSSSRFEIDSLTLTVEKVVSKDLSKGDKPVVEVWNLPIHDKTFSHLTSPEELANLVLVEALQSAAIKGALIYGASAAAGTAFLPLGAAMLMIGQDADMATVRTDYGRAFKAASQALGELGNVTLEDKGSGMLKAVVNGCEITLALHKESFRKIRITASARKLLMSQPRIASGVLYTVLEKLK